MMKRLAIWLLAAVLWSGCYSFKGISIDPNIKTFAVRTFETVAANAPPTLAVEFTEKLKDKVRSETPLVLRTDEPDCEFSGEVADFRVVPVAPKPGETVSANQLRIRLKVRYTINKEGIKTEYPSQGRDFEFFAEFPADQELLTIQNRLMDDISKQLLEDIFNAAFNNW